MPVELIAYTVDMMDQETAQWVIEPASPRRDWMDQTQQKAAYRCLPLAMANQAGWIVRSPATFKAVWKDRKADVDSLSLTFPSPEDQRFAGMIRSNFGLGIITFTLPWLFRTSPGYGLWVRGPSNTPLQDVVALEGLVETDWSPYPFTMNWKITRTKVDVWFRKGDPICMLSPYPLDVLEAVQPRFIPLQANRAAFENYMEWVTTRNNAHRDHREHGAELFELNYMRGFEPLGSKAPAHRTNLKLAPFV